MPTIITVFFERGSFGAFVICLLLFFLAVYLSFFRKKSPKLSQKKNKLSEKKINLMSRSTIIIILIFIQVICFFFSKYAYSENFNTEAGIIEGLLVFISYFSLVALNFYFLLNLFPLWKNYLKTTHILFRSIFFVVHLFIAAMVTRFTELFHII